MDSEQQALVAAVEAAHRANWQDVAYRLVYADWLDEHGMPEEAERQRRFVDAETFLRRYSVEHLGRDDYPFDEYWHEDNDEPPDAAELARRTFIKEWGGPDDPDVRWPYQRLMVLLEAVADGEHYLPYDTPDKFEFTEEMWRNFEIVTGRSGPSGHTRDEMPSFRCAC